MSWLAHLVLNHLKKKNIYWISLTARVCILCHIWTVEPYELIYLWKSWRTQHFFNTFEKGLDGRKQASFSGASRTADWAFCPCLNEFFNCDMCAATCSKTCVRLLAALWEMVLLDSPVRNSRTGLVSGPQELWAASPWLLRTGGVTAVALWGDSTSSLNWSLLSGGTFQKSTEHTHTQDV